jgi:hypothetical protein
MDEREDGVAEALEKRVETIRDHLGLLVSELDRRRHRAGKPIAVAAVAVAALVMLGLGGLIVWRLTRRRA